MAKHVPKQTFNMAKSAESRVHTYRGEETARKLLTWLNGGKAARIEKLLELAARRRKLLEPVSPADFERMLDALRFDPWVSKQIKDKIRKMSDPDRAKQGLAPALNGATGLINRTLAEYNLSPQLWASAEDRWTVSWVGKEVPPEEGIALLRFLELASAGLLDHIRKCERPGCAKYFYSRFRHQRFDGDACRISVLSSDPTRKEARRQAMKDLRKRQKRQRTPTAAKKGGK
jgi:hypothetical protein